MLCFIRIKTQTLWREHFDIILPAHVFIVVIECTILFYIFLKKENFRCAPVTWVHIVQKFEVTNCCVFTFLWSSVVHIHCMLFLYCMRWHGWQCVIVYLPCCHHCELDISFQHLVGVLQTGSDKTRLFVEVASIILFLPDLPVFADLYQRADEKLFSDVTTNNDHVLHSLLPLTSWASRQYHLQWRGNCFELPTRTDCLADCNFIQRVLYFNCS